jgi:hypothetical protein
MGACAGPWRRGAAIQQRRCESRLLIGIDAVAPRAGAAILQCDSAPALALQAQADQRETSG